RGYQPEAFKKFAIQCGLTKHDIFLDWENLNGINRKIIDPVANRYMAVVDPVKISIEDGPEIKKVKTPLHPDFPERGEKTIPVNLAKIYIESEDFTKLKGKEVRLKHLGNVILDRKSRYIGNEIKKDIKKIHWVSEPYINIKIITPSETLKAIAEPWIKRLKTGSIVQFERFGFCRLDSKKEMIFYFTHK
ncbi:MAG: glutamate--tRNA ligase, partial [Candidatus Aenigmatarchaeota archaeon]